MDTSTYAILSRQSGLMREMSVIANNIANSATTGFRQEGVIFSEFIAGSSEGPSISMGNGNVRNTSNSQGALTETGDPFNFAIEGDGYFAVETPRGERLTRAGSFAVNADGDLVTPEGLRVLDSGGAPVFVPPDAGRISVSADGTVSAAGRPIGQIGLVRPIEGSSLTREDGVLFVASDGFEPADGARMLQGFVENSNVDAMSAMARMIEVQRAYELGQSFMDAEDERVREALRALTK